MLAPLVALKNFVKPKSYHIDHPLFRLHYQVTAGLILAFCTILGAKVLFGDVIVCRGREGDMNRSTYFDDFCYVQGTYTTYAFKLYSNLNASQCPGSDIDEQQAYFNETILSPRLRDARKADRCFKNIARYTDPGIPVSEEIMSMFPTDVNRKRTVDHMWYQYLPILLISQAILFCLPHYIWKMCENGVVSSMCEQIQDNRFQPIRFAEDSSDFVDYIKNYLSRNKSLAYKYYFCQLLLLANVIGQIFWLDYIFNGNFIHYGFDTVYYHFVDRNFYGFKAFHNADDERINNPMDHLFPKITACTVLLESEIGDFSTLQFDCVLTLNVFTGQFYLLLWFWFLILAIITASQIMFGFIYLSLPMLQRYLFSKKFHGYPSSQLSEIFLLDLIGSNSDRCAFLTFLRRLAREETPKKLAAIHNRV